MRHVLQHFTPDLMCSKSDYSQTLKRIDGFGNGRGKRSPVVHSVSKIPGCGKKDLAALTYAIGSLSPNSECKYQITCSQRNPRRYPAVLYKAVRSYEEGSCLGKCRPVYKKITVLKKDSADDCSSWKYSVETVVTRVQCFPPNTRGPNSSI